MKKLFLAHTFFILVSPEGNVKFLCPMVSDELSYYPGSSFRRTNGFTHGLLNVTDPKTGLSGFINPKGDIVIPFLYTSVMNFHNGFAIVQKDGIDGVIDNKGKFTAVTDFIYK